MKHMTKCSPQFAALMMAWISERYNGDPPWRPDILRPHLTNPRARWDVRADWKLSFVQTGIPTTAHRGEMDKSPEIVAVRAALDAAGWPDAVIPQDIGLDAVPRRVPAIMHYVGYEKAANKADKRGRSVLSGRRVTIYRRVRP